MQDLIGVSMTTQPLNFPAGVPNSRYFWIPNHFERDQTHIHVALTEDLPLTYKGFGTRYSKLI